MLNPIKNIYISGRRGRDHVVVGFATTCAISAYHHCWRCEFESRTWRGVLDTTFCDIVCQWLAIGRWISTAIKLFKLWAIHDVLLYHKQWKSKHNGVGRERGRVQGRIRQKAKFQNEHKTYLILERGKILWVHDTRWVTLGSQTTEDGNNHTSWHKMTQISAIILSIFAYRDLGRT
jgi:hypothetical protein